MNFLGHELSFWMTTLAAIVLKVAFSRAKTIRAALISALAGLFIAYVFTDPFLAWFDYDPETYKIAAAVALCWTGEIFMRVIVNLCEDPKQLRDWIAAWRGK